MKEIRKSVKENREYLKKWRKENRELFLAQQKRANDKYSKKKMIPYYGEDNMGCNPPIPVRERICHDCGVKYGRYHEEGCDMERCPNCGEQLITCGCM